MSLRRENVTRLENEELDVLILGGGINGATIAAALSAKGVKTGLIDKGDFAGGTSSQTSNLAWGGIKYLESLEFSLVRNLCKSRNRLLRVYPSSVKEIRFLTSVRKGFRYPAIFVYLGALFYWGMGNFKTRIAHYIRAKNLSAIEPVINHSIMSAAFEYSDAYFRDNDSRFVFNFIRSSLDNGAAIANYVESKGAKRDGDVWRTAVVDKETGAVFAIRSKILINACGPQADEQNALTERKTKHRHILSKGVHLIVKQITAHNRILTFFASDGRPFFVIPMGPRTCIGTTDTPVDNADVGVNDEDRQFILDNVNAVLSLPEPLTKSDIIAERCGVRPLAVNSKSKTTDWVQLSRKHAIDVDRPSKHISIFGGKFTDCLNVGDEVADLVASLSSYRFDNKKDWFGEPGEEEKGAYLSRARDLDIDRLTPAHSSEPLSKRFWRRYASRAHELLDLIEQDAANAEPVFEEGEIVYGELYYAAKYEMVTKLEDILRRRTALSLTIRRADLVRGDALKNMSHVLFPDSAQQMLDNFLAPANTPD